MKDEVMTCCQASLSRRKVLAVSSASAAAVAIAACTPAPENDQSPSGDTGVFTPAIELNQMPVGQAHNLIVGKEQLLLFRQDATTVHAYSAVCTHQGCLVGTGAEEPSSPFQCPCHASQFDRISGDVLSGPAIRPLARHQVKIQDGTILVQV